MVKKNRHRAERKKRERILRAQQRISFDSGASINLTRQTARVLSQQREIPEFEIPLVNLIEEDAPLSLNNDIESVENNNDIEILYDKPPMSFHFHNENSLNLEPLDP